MTEQRITSLRDLLDAENVAAILIFGAMNIRYLCGFTGTDGVLFIGEDEAVFLTDSRYVEQAKAETTNVRVECYTNQLNAVAAKLSDCGVKRVAFDARHVTVATFDELSALTESLCWIPLTTQLDPLRGVKTASELTSLKAAADLNRRAFDTVLPMVTDGVSEREVSLELEFTLKRLGGEENSFDFIVASGQRGALPHGVATNKLIRRGELVTIDFGTCVAGYHSDETVTFAVGNVDRKLRQIFDIVLEAHDSAISHVKPGLVVSELDALARNFIASKGYGEYFGHSLGHGVGLDVHEFPPVSARSAVTLEAGMVITVEPGIYIPELGGVRIEDTVVVTPDGCDVLTSIPKQFRQLN